MDLSKRIHEILRAHKKATGKWLPLREEEKRKIEALLAERFGPAWPSTLQTICLQYKEKAEAGFAFYLFALRSDKDADVRMEVLDSLKSFLVPARSDENLRNRLLGSLQLAASTDPEPGVKTAAQKLLRRFE
ncbi:MAG: hypothetical protein ACYTHN_18760 [Planctomycetota bacterium]